MKTSLALRLALGVGVIGLMLAAAVLVFSYATLEMEMTRQHQSVLRDKADHVRHILAGQPDRAASHADELAGLVMGHPELHIIVAEPDAAEPALGAGREAREALRMRREQRWQADAFHQWRMPGTDAPMLSLATTAGPGLDIVVSVDRRADERLLRSLLVTAAIASPFALALVVMSSLAIVNSGLRPLRQLRQAAGRITASDLSARIDLSSLPPELRDLAVGFNDMFGRLDDGVRRLSEFSSDLAHELRTPLATLLSGTQVALSQPRTAEELAAVLEGNLDELQRLIRLVADMLFLARADDAGSALQRQPLDLGREAQEVADFLEPLAAERQVAITVTGGGWAFAQRDLVRRAITNLLSNALRHGVVGAPVRIEIGEEGEWATVAVHNAGAPIAPEHMDRLFDRFYRIDSARARDQGGTGLGLAIVRAIMTLHRGSVAVASTHDGATRFTLRLPTARPQNRPGPAGALAPPSTRPDRAKHTVEP